MKTDISDVLAAAIDGYLRFFDTSTTLASAMFGASLFLIVRAVGLVQDSKIGQIAGTRLITTAGLCALVVIVTGFLAQNVALSFYVEMLLPAPFGDCTFPADREPARFFLDCHRVILRSLVWVNLVFSLIAVACLGLWFILQSRSVRRENP